MSETAISPPANMIPEPSSLKTVMRTASCFTSPPVTSKVRGTLPAWAMVLDTGISAATVLSGLRGVNTASRFAASALSGSSWGFEAAGC